MNKAELVAAIAAKLECSQKDADRVVNVFTQAVMEAVAAGEKVALVGFGTFEPKDRKAREGRNPKTGETIAIPAGRVPVFSAGKVFKQAVKGGE